MFFFSLDGAQEVLILSVHPTVHLICLSVRHATLISFKVRSKVCKKVEKCSRRFMKSQGESIRVKVSQGESR